MATLLLILIYLAFISLGLPDSILGVAWPIMQNDLAVSLDYGGYVSLIVTVGTVLSSLSSGYLIKRLKTGRVIVISIFLTSFALFGYSLTNQYGLLLLFALPLGFGAGAIDTALNNYVALHYKSHHMNWLHSFWGVGASIGPAIMSYFLLGNDWHQGFMSIAFIQFILMLVIMLSLPLWEKQDIIHEESFEEHTPKKIWQIKGITYALLIFLIYCAIEFSVGIWGSSFLVHSKGISVSKAAQIITLYYLGITGGRFISGGLSFILSNKKLIFCGIVIVLIGANILFITKTEAFIIASFGLIGLGLAPIFPSMIHETPTHFGRENSQYVIGYQVAFAYIGSAVFPSMFGILYSHVSVSLFPMSILSLAIVLLLLTSILTIKVNTHKKRLLR